jgi:nucleotide-binding universal stress UspA family protein
MTRVLYATDFSREAEIAEREAVRLAHALGAEIVVVHVSAESALYGETPFGIQQVREVYEQQARWAEERLAELTRSISAGGVPARWIRRVGVTHEEIVKTAAEEQVDYVVIGTHGRGGVGRFMLGSVADRVVRSATCPVVTVRGQPH